MRRREFLNRCAVATTLATGPVMGRAKASQTTKSGAGEIDVEAVAKSAVTHLTVDKYACSESVLLAGCESLGIECKLVPDIAAGLAGGIGLQGDTCGVVTGAAMAISLAVAAKETDREAKRKKSLEAVGRFHQAFKKEFGDSRCRILSGFDLTTPEGREGLKKSKKCARVVKRGAEFMARELKRI